MSYKFDVYSYGMLLLEMVGGKKNVDMSFAQHFLVLYPDQIHNLVDGYVHIHGEDEGNVWGWAHVGIGRGRVNVIDGVGVQGSLVYVCEKKCLVTKGSCSSNLKVEAAFDDRGR